MLKKRKRNQYQQRSKSFTPPRQLGVCCKYAKLGGSDEEFSSIYKEVDIELRSFISYDQDGESNGRYFRLSENNSILNTFEKVGEADNAFFSAVDSKINNGWIKIKGNEFHEIFA